MVVDGPLLFEAQDPCSIRETNWEVKELEGVFVDYYICIYIDIFILCVCILLRGSPTSDEVVTY